jgi:hypothetical protein
MAVIVVVLLMASLQSGCLRLIDGERERGGSAMTQGSEIQFIVPTLGQVRGFSPGAFNADLAREKGLLFIDGSLSWEYLILQSGYRAAFNEFLNDACDLESYEKELSENEKYDFVVETLFSTVYSRIGSFGRDYIFLRNDFNIEVLEDEDFRLLKSSCDRSSIMYTEEVREMVERTYRDVIRVEYTPGQAPFDVIYDGETLSPFFAPNDAVVLGIWYTVEHAEDGSLAHPEEQPEMEEYLEAMRREMQRDMGEILKTPVVIFIY